MKKIICELCESMEFIKENGMFVCQGCGTKYTAEEVRGMMREVEGGAAPVMPAGNPNQQLDNILMLATNAFSASNNEETEKYCNRAIELDATCYKAWFLKGKAAGWSSTIRNPRIVEAAHSFKQAVDFAPDEEKESLTEEAVEELKRLGLACISLRKNRFSQYPNKEELNGFASDVEPLIEGLIILLDKQNDAEVAKAESLLAACVGDLASLKFLGIKNKAVAAGVPKEYFTQITDMMTDAAVAGFNKTTRDYNNDNRPMPNDFRKCLNEVDNCIILLTIVQASDDDGDKNVKRYNNIIKMFEFSINMTAYADYGSSYRSWSLTDSAKKSRRETISGYKKSIKEIENKAKEKAAEERRKAEEEKKARIVAYWEAHADEKAALDAEKKELEDKKAKLSAEITEQDKLIKAAREIAQEDKKVDVPSEAERDKLVNQIKELENRRLGLGLFSSKQKKQISEEIASLEGRISILSDKIKEEKNARNAEADKKADKKEAPAKAKKEELQDQLNAANKRISAIDAALTKDPEEK